MQENGPDGRNVAEMPRMPVLIPVSDVGPTLLSQPWNCSGERPIMLTDVSQDFPDAWYQSVKALVNGALPCPTSKSSIHSAPSVTRVTASVQELKYHPTDRIRPSQTFRWFIVD